MKATDKQIVDFIIGFTEMYRLFNQDMNEYIMGITETIKDFEFSSLDVNNLKEEGRINFLMRLDIWVNEMKRVQEANKLINK